VAGPSNLSSSERRLRIVEFRRVAPPVGKDVINTAQEMVVAKKAQQKAGRAASASGAVNRLKNLEKFDFARGCEFTAYLTWAAEDTENAGGFREKRLPHPLSITARKCNLVPVAGPPGYGIRVRQSGFFRVAAVYSASGRASEVILPNLSINSEHRFQRTRKCCEEIL
jgi:hypothetical protein